VAAVLRGRVPRRLCRLCRAELHAARAVADVGAAWDELAHLDQLVALNPGHPKPLEYRADAHDRCGDHAAAAEDLTSAIAISAIHYAYRAQAHCNAGQWGAAVDDYTDAIARGPGAKLGLCYRNRAVAYENLGRPDLAAADLRQCLLTFPGDTAARDALARLEATPPSAGVTPLS